MLFQDLMRVVGDEVEDVEEELFLIFSQEIPSQDLGFIDPRSNTISVTVHGRDFTIYQSPTVLSSSRPGGTTGAVLWKITPLIAEWLSSKENILWTSSTLNHDSLVVELGCGISGLTAISLAPSIARYFLTDQIYIQKLLEENLESNCAPSPTPCQANQRHSSHSRRLRKQSSSSPPVCNHSKRNSNDEVQTRGLGNIIFLPLDWELDSVHTLREILTPSKLKPIHGLRRPISTLKKPQADNHPGFDILLACDCIYNDALINPFVQTCVDICRFRSACMPSELDVGDVQSPQVSESPLNPTLCIIAQQLRSPDIFENWLRASIAEFRVWRVKDEVLGKDLQSGSGYVVHILALREACG